MSEARSGLFDPLVAGRDPPSIHFVPSVSVAPWIRIEARMTKAAASKIALPCWTPELSTSTAKSIPATPFGPNQAMNALCGCGRSTRMKARKIATGRAMNRAKAMKATSSATSLW